MISLKGVSHWTVVGGAKLQNSLIGWQWSVNHPAKYR